ncbi:MAG: hypothetical protein K6V73_12040 [Firmicutes bacterium]|nr:hypothetical protein [Bacillota bacterium]
MRRRGAAVERGGALAAAALLAALPGVAAARPAPPPFPPVVAQALAAVAARAPTLGLPVGGPLALPPEPPSHTYLTAQTRVGRGAWSVLLVRTDAPYAVDNPAIAEPAAHASPVAEFGVARAQGRPSDRPAALAAYLWRESLALGGLVPRGGLPPLPFAGAARSIDLGEGIVGAVRQAGPGAVSITWREGEWTLAVLDVAPATARAIARALVAYLHVALLPPHPGVAAVAVAVGGVTTRLAWLARGDVYHVEDVLAWGENPVAACAMAVSWRDR